VNTSVSILVKTGLKKETLIALIEDILRERENVQRNNHTKIQFAANAILLLWSECFEKNNWALKKESDRYGFTVHYALKANSNAEILQVINKSGLGADCVSGNEVKRAVWNRIRFRSYCFCGVGKSDEEINYALQHDIFCFNCESPMELEVLNELAGKSKKIVSIALRINPNVNANTHKYITTGLEENKFGINIWELESVVSSLSSFKNLKLIDSIFISDHRSHDLLHSVRYACAWMNCRNGSWVIKLLCSISMWWRTRIELSRTG